MSAAWQAKPGDWMCPLCNTRVFAWKSQCLCGGQKTTAQSQGAVVMKAGDWPCPNCGDIVFARNSSCRKCGAAKPAGTAAGSSVASTSASGAASAGAAASAAAASSGYAAGGPPRQDWPCPSCGDIVFASKSACRKCGTTRPTQDGGASSTPPQTSSGRLGDWTCPSCQDLVFGSKSNCRKCGAARPSAGPGSGPGPTPPTASTASGDWNCPNCKDLVFGSKTNCRKCGTARPVGTAPPTSSTSSDGLRQGDWMCGRCGDHVFAKNDACRKCGLQRNAWRCPKCQDFGTEDPCTKCSTARPHPVTSSSAAAASQPALRAGDWRCPKCEDVQFARNAACRSCGEARPSYLGASMGLAPPQYWTSNGEGFSLAVASPEELQALSKGLRPGGSFGGRDQRKGGSYNTLQVTRAWRLQHPGLWGKYAMERENLRSMDMKALKGCNIEVKPIKVRDDFEQMMKELPADLDKELNEVYLSHGSKPEILPAIFAGGLNERYSGGLFGNGTYFAEDIAKNDQYCTPDQRYGDAPALHKMLYDATGLTHPGQVYYVFVCRVLLGHEIRTKDGSTVLDEAAAGGRAKSIWSSQSRELACVEGSNPPVLHHSLVVELGAKLLRFREFIVYHGDRIYPEYLVAYQRV